MEEVRALEAPGSNLGGWGGHLTAGRGYEWGAPWPNWGPGDGARGGSGVRGRLPGRGTGGLLGGVAPPRLRKRGVPGLRETETTPSVPESGQGCTGRRTLAAPKAGGGRRGEEARPPQLPRARGSLPETPPPPAPDVATAAAARQSHPRNSAAGLSLPPQVGAVDSGGAPQPQDPGTGSGSSAAQGRTPTPAAAMMD